MDFSTRILARPHTDLLTQGWRIRTGARSPADPRHLHSLTHALRPVQLLAGRCTHAPAQESTYMHSPTCTHPHVLHHTRTQQTTSARTRARARTYGTARKQACTRSRTARTALAPRMHARSRSRLCAISTIQMFTNAHAPPSRNRNEARMPTDTAASRQTSARTCTLTVTLACRYKTRRNAQA
eukprot:6204589-Pleurochrysis_carterae.AAC.1